MLPELIIQGFRVKDYAYQWIKGGCPLHQWVSGARGIDRGVIEHAIYLRNRYAHQKGGWGLVSLVDYLWDHEGAAPEPYDPAPRNNFSENNSPN